MTVCRRYSCDQKEAEDILQESFIRVFAHINQYKSEGSLEGWIRRIAVNTALTFLKKKKIRFTELHEAIPEAPSIDADALTGLGTEELLKMISRLPEGYRIVFNLYVLEGYDHNEIGKLLDISPGTSRSQLAKAKKSLKHQIIAQQKLPNGYA
jgi:RNA polymerase sigma factor (sigma-70 family)